MITQPTASATDKQDLLQLLFELPTSTPGWIRRFDQSCAGRTDWQAECDRLIADHDGGSAEAFARVGWYLLEQGEAGQALSWFDKAAQAGSIGWWLSLRQALAMGLQGDVASAEDLIERLYRQHAEARNGYAGLAWGLSGRVSSEQALAWVEKDRQAGRLTPAFAINHAQLLAADGRWSEAEVELEKAYASDARLRDAYIRLAWQHTVRKDWQAAWELAQRDLQLQRLSPGWQLNLAWILGHLQRLDEAGQLIEAAYAQDEGLTDGFAQLGWIVCELGNARQGLVLMHRDRDLQRLSPAWRDECRLLETRLGEVPQPEDTVVLAGLLEHRLSQCGEKGCTDQAFHARSLARLQDLPAGPANEVLSGLLQDLVALLSSGQADPGLLLSTLQGLEADRKSHAPRRYPALLEWLSDYRQRLSDALADLSSAADMFPGFGAENTAAALRRSLEIADKMLGRPCGVIGDRLAQYGAIVQLSSDGREPVRVLELGSLFGGSCMLYLLAGRDLGADVRVECIDPLDGYYGQDQDPSSGLRVCPETIWENLSRLQLPAEAVRLRRYMSNDPRALQGLQADSIDLLLIDADHSHEGVLADWAIYRHFIRPGGLVIFDDYGPQHPGVISAVDEICADLPGWSRLGCLGTSVMLRRSPAG